MENVRPGTEENRPIGLNIYEAGCSFLNPDGSGRQKKAGNDWNITGPSIEQIGVGLFYGFNQFFECFWLIHGQICKDLTVKRNSFLVEFMDKG